MIHKITERVDEVEKTFYKKLKEIRLNKKYTQEELAGKIGMDQQAICYLESRYHLPTCRTLVKLSYALNVSINYLLGIE